MNKKSSGSESNSKQQNNSEAVIPMSLAYKKGYLFMWEIYLFFSNWFNYKCRESHTEELLKASELVLYYDLDTDLKEENKPSVIQITDFNCNTQNAVTQFSNPVFQFLNYISILIYL